MSDGSLPIVQLHKQLGTSLGDEKGQVRTFKQSVTLQTDCPKSGSFIRPQPNALSRPNSRHDRRQSGSQCHVSGITVCFYAHSIGHIADPGLGIGVAKRATGARRAVGRGWPKGKLGQVFMNPREYSISPFLHSSKNPRDGGTDGAANATDVSARKSSSCPSVAKTP